MAITLSLRFPTGRYTAAAWDDKDQSEWPPHPARLCLALVDVLHKAGNPQSLRNALTWLCEQTPPLIIIPDRKRIDFHKLDGFYVPQNPSQAKSGIKHPRKPRAFPTVFVDAEEAAIFFHWPEAMPSPTTLQDLSDLVTRLPRFGHSSSLVVANLSEEAPPSGSDWQWIEPATSESRQSDFRIRVPYSGLLEAAESAYAADARKEEMANLIQRAKKSAKLEKSLNPAASSRGRHDPRHRWQNYLTQLPSDLASTPWDNRIMLLARCDGPRPGLISTWQIVDALHKALLDRWCRDPQRGPVPSWISGHRPGKGSTAPATDNHLALFPIADVGHQHAEGRLMGIGFAFPRPETASTDTITQRLDWQKVMAALFPKGEVLYLASASGKPLFNLKPADPIESRKSFLPPRWIGPSKTWSSVSPVVLDRHPKPDFKKDPVAWQESCQQIVRTACQRLGLPVPVQIDVSSYSSRLGVPPAAAFTPPPARPGRPARVHYHVEVNFDEEVIGPILLGAGRFRGYGLFAPHR